jgi:hypothetical protein
MSPFALAVAASLAAAAPAPHLTLLYTADNAGELAPCG